MLDSPSFFPKNATLSGNLISRYTLYKAFHMGADTLGVGMDLNRAITVQVANLTPNQSYKIATSDNGTTWTDLTGSGVTADTDGTVSFRTGHLGYFAVISGSIIQAPTCTIQADTVSPLTGQPVNLSWNSTQADSANLSPDTGTVNVNGSLRVNPSVPTAYTLTVTNTVGSGSCSVTVSPHNA